VVEILDEDAYRPSARGDPRGSPPTYSDEFGDGSVRILGVGTCGPDIPGRRTYHLAWTAAASGAGGPVERLLSSFELTLANDEWRIALWYLGPLEEWEGQVADPMGNAFCEAGRSPWG
jgi:hypothetical protein